ncbi:MAG: tetratricopeptide repeat protein [Pirellulaceae bacterium]|nr:tetratricopeptide repeat protein [Pirellulaceae bacterium]
MNIDQDALERLLTEAIELARQNLRQTPSIITRESRRRFAQNPSDRSAMHVIAAASLVDQQPEKSLSVLNQRPDLLETDASSNRLAGYACIMCDDFHAAKKHFDISVRITPGQADCWTWLGQLAQRDGQTDQAIGYYERAIVFDDDRHQSALALSRLHAKNRKLQDAIHTLRVCLFRDQRSAKLNLALAKLLKRRAILMKRKKKHRSQRRLMQEALQCYLTANAAQPMSRTLVAQGLLQQRMGLFHDAKSSFERAVQQDPTSATAITYLASANVDCGNMTEAIAQFECSLSIDPQRASTHFRYSRAKRFAAGPASQRYAAQLTGLLENSDRGPRERTHLHFALAKVLDDTGCFDEAWIHYSQANELKPGHSRSGQTRKRTTANHGAPLERLAADSQQFFTRQWFASHSHLGNPTATPIFIIGMPRSGTTLTEQILSSHSEVAGAGELNWIEQIRHEIVARHLHSQRPPMIPGQDRATPIAPDPSLYPRVLDSLNAEQVQIHANHYLAQLNGHRRSESRVTDKMPTNFMHLGLIATMFPNATIIHCRRNPMDVFVSSYCQNLNAPFCDLYQLVDYYHQYQHLMEHWTNVLPIKIHDVDYEQMVTDPLKHSRELIEHCGLNWEDQCLRFHQNERLVHTPSKWQVRQPMYSSSVEKWRRFEKHLIETAAKVGQPV